MLFLPPLLSTTSTSYTLICVLCALYLDLYLHSAFLQMVNGTQLLATGFSITSPPARTTPAGADSSHLLLLN